MLDMIWTKVDPVLAKWGLTKTEAWLLAVVVFTVLVNKGYVDQAWLDWLKANPWEAAVAAWVPAAYFQRLGTKKAQQAAGELERAKIR